MSDLQRATRDAFRLDTPRELEYFQHGGILPYVLRDTLAAGARQPG